MALLPGNRLAFLVGLGQGAELEPLEEVSTFSDLCEKFPNFQDEWLRDLPNEVWVPQAYKGKPFNIFETGGTTGMPKQRIGWEDYRIDYTAFSETLSDEHFPRDHYWMMVGPTGPLPSLGHRALGERMDAPVTSSTWTPVGSSALIASKQFDQARAYMDHAVDQALTILKHRSVSALFTTPKLLEALSERRDLVRAGIKGVFCGGTTMDKQYARFLVEEVCEGGKIGFVPTYGNTLMGLARHHPIGPENDYSIAYYAPQPRAVLRVIDPESNKPVDYDTWGRVELTTMTKEFFMPRFLERDEALRRKPWSEAPWDGVAEVRPFGAMEKNIVEGVY